VRGLAEGGALSVSDHAINPPLRRLTSRTAPEFRSELPESCFPFSPHRALLSVRPEFPARQPTETNMAKSKKTETLEPEPIAAVEVTAPGTPKRKAKKPTEPTTLAAIFAGYLASLDERGASSGTIASYRMELDLAAKALGIDTPIANLTDTQVAAYFESDPVTKKRNGKPKSPLSIDKTRRVLRQALTWAGHADLVPTTEVAS
jgi:hypothetical protein